MNKFAMSKGISSSDYYGEAAPGHDSPGESRFERIKETGINILTTAKEGAKGVRYTTLISQLKNIASNWIKSFRKGGDQGSS